KDLVFFINQKGIIDCQKSILNGKILETEYLYLTLGIIVGVIGLIALIFAITSLTYAKRKSVVRHKVALFIFTLMPIAIVACATTYLIFELDNLTDIIKYVTYGVIGAFGFIVLCNMLGIIFGRSEQFMSNDNNKYAFNNASLRNARVDANNNVKSAQELVARPQQMQSQGVNPPQQQSTASMMQQRAQARRMQNSQQPLVRPMQLSRPAQPVRTGMPTNPNRTGVSRPVGVMGTAQPTHATANMQGQIRPTQQPNTTPVRRYCQKCGKLLQPNEKFCTLCGLLDKQGN
ncbi:MAG: hypothetical protein J6Q15_03410, partial [Clostridia bacterium]|nr:hypothetical protein [Clostridia bacterium]